MVDAEQETLCRRVLPAVIDTSPGVRVTRTVQPSPQEVVVFFALSQNPGEFHLVCHFAGGGMSLSKRLLGAVMINGFVLSDAAVFFLREGWLTTQDSVAAAPTPGRFNPRFELSAPVAYVLQQALAALPRMGIYMMIAAAYALVYGLTGRINLAFGAFAALGGMCAVLAVQLVDLLHLPALTPAIAAAAFAASMTAGLFGRITARLVVVPMVRRSGQHILVASAGLMLLLEEFLRLTQGANALWLAPVFNAPMLVAAAPGFDVTVTPMALAVSLIAAGASLFLLGAVRFGEFGRNWRASADDATAAELFGVNHAHLVLETFGLATAIAGCAGYLVALHYGGIGFSGGTTLGLTALVAAIIGGIGSLPGALLGGALIGAIEAIWSSFMPIVYKDGVVFLLLVLLLALKPGGLFSGRQPGPMRV